MAALAGIAGAVAWVAYSGAIGGQPDGLPVSTTVGPDASMSTPGEPAGKGSDATSVPETVDEAVREFKRGLAEAFPPESCFEPDSG